MNQFIHFLLYILIFSKSVNIYSQTSEVTKINSPVGNDLIIIGGSGYDDRESGSDVIIDGGPRHNSEVSSGAFGNINIGVNKTTKVFLGNTTNETRIQSNAYFNKQVNFSGPLSIGVAIPAADIASHNLYVKGISHFDNSVAIGTKDMPTGYKLYVAQGILTPKIRIATLSGKDWKDEVFSKEYKLNSLAYVENYIQKNHHLPNIPSANEVEKKGYELAQMDAKFLEKIEELTLYLIEQNKQLIKQNKELERHNEELLKMNSRLLELEKK